MVIEAPGDSQLGPGSQVPACIGGCAIERWEGMFMLADIAEQINLQRDLQHRHHDEKDCSRCLGISCISILV